jgi:hypothetical protein
VTIEVHVGEDVEGVGIVLQGGLLELPDGLEEWTADGNGRAIFFLWCCACAKAGEGVEDVFEDGVEDGL